MSSCRVSSVDQIFVGSATPHLSDGGTAASDDRQRQHVSPFHRIGPTLGANNTPDDDQPLDLTAGGGLASAARKRRGSPSPQSPGQRDLDLDSPLDLSVKRSRTANVDPGPWSAGYGMLGVDTTGPGNSLFHDLFNSLKVRDISL